MARLFDDASSEYLWFNGAVITSEPITMSCWFNSNDITANQTLISLGNNGAQGVWRLAAMGGVGGDPVRAQKQSDAGATAQADTTTGFSANTWHHACAVFNSNTSRSAYLDGGSAATNTTSVTDPTADFTAVGTMLRSAATQFMSGRQADAAIWNVALTQSEIQALSKGFPAHLIRPQNLVAYWPLNGLQSPEVDLSGNANNLTLVGTAKANHAPIRMFTPYRSFLDEVAVGGFQPAWAARATRTIGMPGIGYA